MVGDALGVEGSFPYNHRAPSRFGFQVGRDVHLGLKPCASAPFQYYSQLWHLSSNRNCIYANKIPRSEINGRTHARNCMGIRITHAVTCMGVANTLLFHSKTSFSSLLAELLHRCRTHAVQNVFPMYSCSRYKA